MTKLNLVRSRALFAAAALSGAALMSTPAQAAINLCTSGSSCVTGTTNVNLNKAPDAGALTVTGNVGGAGGALVTFNSTQGLLNTNPGAATVYTQSGALLTNLTFTILAGFTAAEFNLENGDPKSFTVSLTDSAGDMFMQTISNLNGSNVFTITGNSPGQVFTTASFTSTDGGFVDFKQLRVISAVAASVPEPSTWALMLIGFGGMGVAMRRRRSSSLLTQMA